MRKTLVIAAVLVLTIAPAALAAGSPRPDVIKQCDSSLREQLVAPLEAKLLNVGVRQIVGTGSRVFICYQARTRNGGFGKAAGTCKIDLDSRISEYSIADSDFQADLYCTNAKEYGKKGM